MSNFRDTEPRHLLELPESDLSLIMDSLLAQEETMMDTADGYRDSRQDNYYKYFEEQAIKARKLRQRLTEQTGVTVISINQMAEDADEYI